MARKPVHLEMTGGKSPRQRIWEAIRKQRGTFDQIEISRSSKLSASIVRDYFRALTNGGYLEVCESLAINKACVKKVYRLARDIGVEAPRLTRAGAEVVQGSVNDAMWGTLRRMFKTESVDYRQLAAFASTAGAPISDGTAKAYVLALAAAGYLECVQPAARGNAPLAARYRLRPAMESGHRAPMIQRTKCVFDPNWNKVVWTDQKGTNDDE